MRSRNNRQGNLAAEGRSRGDRYATEASGSHEDWQDDIAVDGGYGGKSRQNRNNSDRDDEPVDRILTSLDRLGDRIRSMTPDRRANRVEKPATPRRAPNAGIELQRAIEQIALRRDSLERERDDVPAPTNSRTSREPRGRAEPIETRRPVVEPRRPAPEMRPMASARPAPPLDDFRSEIRDLRSAVDRLAEPRNDANRQLRDLGERIDRAARTSVDPVVIQRIREDIASLRDAMQTALDATPLNKLETAYSSIVRRLDDMRDSIDNPRLVGDLVQRLADIRRLLAQAPTENHLLSISDRLEELSTRVDNGAGGNVAAMRDLNSQVAQVAKAVAGIDQGAIAQAIEMRLAEVSGQVAAMEQRLGRLDSLDRFSENFDRQASTLSQIVQRSDQLPRVAFEMERQTAAFGDLARSVEALPRLESDLAAVKQSLDHDKAGSSRALEALVARIDALAARVETGDRSMTEASLDMRLTEITNRLDRFNEQVDVDGMDRLQAHFAHLAATIESRLPPVSDGPEELPVELMEALARIEAQLSTREPDRGLQHLEDRIEVLTRQIEQTGRQSLPDLGFIEDSIAALRDDVASSLRSPLDNIEQELQVLAERLDGLQVQQLHPEMLDQLEQRIAHLADKISDQPDPTAHMEDMLLRFERTVTNLISPELIAESAARAAVAAVSDRDTSADIADLVSGLRQDFADLQDDLRNGNRRDRDLLIALGEAVERLAQREVDLATKPARGDVPTSDTDAWKEIERTLAEGINGRNREAEAVPAAEPVIPAVLPGATTVAAVEPETSALDRIFNRRASAKAKRASEAAANKAPVENTIAPDAPPLGFDINKPLEPGSGKPSVRIEARKAESPQVVDTPVAQPAPRLEAAASEAPRTEPSKADFIAAARRAAQAAGADSASSPRRKDQNPAAAVRTPAAPAEKAARFAGLRSFITRNRRQVLMATAAVLVVLGATRIVVNMLFLNDGDMTAIEEVQPQEATVTPSTESVPTETVPADVASAPADTPAPADVAPAADTAAAQPISEPAPDTVIADTSPPAPPTPPAALPDAAATSSTPIGPAGQFAAKPEAPSADKFTTPNTASTLMPPEAVGPLPLREAAASGDPLAQFEVAARLTEGRGVKQDIPAAIVWYQKAADAGLAPAQYRLGSLYEKGQGVTRDSKLAAELYAKAANAGNAKAMYNLAVLHAEGGLGNPNYDEASKWFLSAADLGIRDSQYNLGILYARGLGVPRDLASSYKWFAIAANAGDADAAKKRDDVAQVLDKDNLAKARLAVETWKAKTPDPAANDVVIANPSWQAAPEETAASGKDTDSQIMRAQQLLAKLGYDAGPADGKMGKRTHDAITAFQKAKGLAETGKVDAALIQSLSEQAI